MGKRLLKKVVKWLVGWAIVDEIDLGSEEVPDVEFLAEVLREQFGDDADIEIADIEREHLDAERGVRLNFTGVSVLVTSHVGSRQLVLRANPSTWVALPIFLTFLVLVGFLILPAYWMMRVWPVRWKVEGALRERFAPEEESDASSTWQKIKVPALLAVAAVGLPVVVSGLVLGHTVWANLQYEFPEPNGEVNIEMIEEVNYQEQTIGVDDPDGAIERLERVVASETTPIRDPLFLLGKGMILLDRNGHMAGSDLKIHIGWTPEDGGGEQEWFIAQRDSVVMVKNETTDTSYYRRTEMTDDELIDRIRSGSD